MYRKEPLYIELPPLGECEKAIEAIDRQITGQLLIPDHLLHPRYLSTFEEQMAMRQERGRCNLDRRRRTLLSTLFPPK